MNPLLKPFLPVSFAIVLAGCMAPVTHEPANLSTLKREVDRYAGSGRYEADLAAVSRAAQKWISRRARQGGGNLAVVLDIDETVLSNLEHMRENDWGYHPGRWDAWMKQADAPALDPVRGIYQCARKHDVAVFFITGRSESVRSATVRNLKAAGMGDYGGLILRADGSGRSAAVIKAEQRRRLSERGFTIIASIGDQQSDLDGGYAERVFKLPNPFYLIH
ncbi:MAG: HAD family acid phosphatase [Verrucomicrobiales bacterium]|nr:HAD family acid phosphatase [Verrucomicrobiota bacterium JB025]